MKNLLILFFIFIFSGCQDHVRPETCKEKGFKGMVIDDSGIFMACSNGDILSGGYITTDGLRPFQSVPNKHGLSHKHYFLKFID